MTSFSFDTLGASKQLREAGMPEGMAEAVVSVFQHAAMTPDISHLATRGDLDAASLAMKADLEATTRAMKADLEATTRAMKADLEARTLALKADLETATRALKADIEGLGLSSKVELANLRADVSEKLRMQGWATLGGTAAVVAVATAIIKLA